MCNELTDIFGEVISTYTSEQATEDGILIKVDHPAINYITHTVFERCIEPFIESSVVTDRSSADKPNFEIIEIGAKKLALSLNITEEEKGKAAEKLIKKLLNSAVEAARKTGRQDHLYTDLDVRGWKLWLGQNETGKYTLMFPEDY